MQQLERDYLIHSFIYYHLHNNVISDYEYDGICVILLRSIKQGYQPEYPQWVTEEALLAGTGHHIPSNQYPMWVIKEAYELLNG